jgi:multiple sugar transport system ATP-binding protein
MVGIRPEHASIGNDGLGVEIVSTEILGSGTILHGTAVTGEEFSVSLRGISGTKAGDKIRISLDPRFVHVFDETGTAVGASNDWRADYLVT